MSRALARFLVVAALALSASAALADSFTLHRVLASLTVFPLIGFFLTMKLEKA